MERKIKKVGNKWHIEDSVLGWIVCDRIGGLSDPGERDQERVETLAASIEYKDFCVDGDSLVGGFRGHHCP